MSRNFDNPVDHKLDLGLVNYVRHPDNPDYVIFRLQDEKRAEGFQKSLEDENIWFEKSHQDTQQRRYHLFGIHKNDFKKVQRINYAIEGQHRKPFISVAWIRYFLILFSALVIGLAIMGYYKSREKLNSYNDSGILIIPEE